MKRALVLALGIATVALGACGDDLRPAVTHDGGSDAAPPDTAPPGATLTTFVIDLIVNQTADNTPPKAFTDFSTLPDPDGDNNNVDAYKSLFP